MKRVDVRGKQCPLPIIETKKALREEPAGNGFIILIDNETSLNNVCKFLDDNKCSYLKKREDDYWSLTVIHGEGEIADLPAEDYCNLPEAVSPGRGPVVVLSSDKMGHGDDILGKKLITSFVNILTELDALPEAVVCYNGGVMLALADSPVVETLAELERRGVDIVLCGTCIDFFGLKSKTGAGRIGDMYQIASLIAGASSVIKP